MFAKNIVYLCNYEQIEWMMKSFVLFYSCVVFYLGNILVSFSPLLNLFLAFLAMHLTHLFKV